MKIGFITDTNILKKSPEKLNKEKEYLNNIDFFVEYIESLEKTYSDKQLVYFMPSIIIEELYYQKLLVFKKRYDALKDSYNDIAYGLIGNLPECNIEKVLLEEKEKYKNNKKIKLLELQYDESIFNEIIEDALRKNPPFDKSLEKGKSDGGFKDALIWKTIIYNKAIDDCEIIYFFSGDNIFIENEEDLMNEFKEHHVNTELKIIFYAPNGEQRQNCLKKIIQDNNLIETEIIKLYDLDLILNAIKTIRYNYVEETCYNDQEENNNLIDVLFNKFSTNDFYIENVKEEDGKYKVFIHYRTKKYDVSNDEDIINKNYLEGKIKLFFKKNKGKFKLEDYEIVYSRFVIGIEEAIINLSNTLKTNIVLPNIEMQNQIISNNLASLMKTIKSLNSIFVDREMINQFVNYTPFWMEEIKKAKDNLLCLETLNDCIEKNQVKIEIANNTKKLSNKTEKREERKNGK